MSHGCSDGCNHESVSSETGSGFSLYSKIDLENLECLNETVEDSCKSIFTSWEERLEPSHYVLSDIGSDLLFNIPFTASVKLKAFIIVCHDESSAPFEVKLFKNRQKMTLDDCCIEPEQTFILHPDFDGSIQYLTKQMKFSSMNYLSMYIPRSIDDEQTRINYIGLKGDFVEAHKHGVTICTYEARPTLADLKNPLKEHQLHHIQ